MKNRKGAEGEEGWKKLSVLLSFQA
jgi:hypothetical protein